MTKRTIIFGLTLLAIGMIAIWWCFQPEDHQLLNQNAGLLTKMPQWESRQGIKNDDQRGVVTFESEATTATIIDLHVTDAADAVGGYFEAGNLCLLEDKP